MHSHGGPWKPLRKVPDSVFASPRSHALRGNAYRSSQAFPLHLPGWEFQVCIPTGDRGSPLRKFRIQCLLPPRSHALRGNAYRSSQAFPLHLPGWKFRVCIPTGDRGNELKKWLVNRIIFIPGGPWESSQKVPDSVFAFPLVPTLCVGMHTGVLRHSRCIYLAGSFGYAFPRETVGVLSESTGFSVCFPLVPTLCVGMHTGVLRHSRCIYLAGSFGYAFPRGTVGTSSRNGWSTGLSSFPGDRESPLRKYRIQCLLSPSFPRSAWECIPEFSGIPVASIWLGVSGMHSHGKPWESSQKVPDSVFASPSFPRSAWECIPEFSGIPVAFTWLEVSGMHSHGGPWERAQEMAGQQDYLHSRETVGVLSESTGFSVCFDCVWVDVHQRNVNFHQPEVSNPICYAGIYLSCSLGILDCSLRCILFPSLINQGLYS